MIFDHFRRSRTTPLALLFAFAVNAPLAPQQATSSQAQELRQLATEYAQKGPLMTRARFERFSDLMEKNKDRDISAIAGLCGGHGSSGTGGSGGSGATTASGRRKDEGDACLWRCITGSSVY